MKTLNDLNIEQLNYLRNKWTSEAKELERKIFRAQNKLKARISKQYINNIFLDELRIALNNGEEILKHLQITAASKETIEIQQQIVEKLQQQYHKASISLTLITEEEAQLQQATIDELELFKSYRETKVLIIEELLAVDSKKTVVSSKVVPPKTSFKPSDRVAKRFGISRIRSSRLKMNVPCLDPFSYRMASKPVASVMLRDGPHMSG